MARWLAERCRAALILIVGTAAVSACASATTSGTGSGESSDLARSAAALRCSGGAVGFAVDGGGGHGAATATEAVSQYVTATRATDPIARYVSRSTKWTIVHDSNGDAETFTAPSVVLHVVRLRNGWIVDRRQLLSMTHPGMPLVVRDVPMSVFPSRMFMRITTYGVRQIQLLLAADRRFRNPSRTASRPSSASAQARPSGRAADRR
jgi:hypothetical protein